ncbi:sterol desaturase family protein [Sorangium sp. So ce381]|uniref:sterol desaturase family protein n=1 Tax=Sorangium sp. So ce381 TaxID=3133307 RepID=UPI003F5BF8EF
MTVTSTERTARPATCQMFETPLIERFSRIHPITPFVFWLPVYSYLGVRAARHGVGLLTGLGLVLVGLFLWTLAEYVLHRYVFHYVGPRLWQRRMHFVLHGVHHDFPQDADRLVMPLGASIPLGVAFYTLFRVVFGPVPADPLFIGFGLGYLAYDGTHYAIHHFRMSSRWGKWIKRHHMVHHHTGENARWGVSSPLWDWIFGTMGTSQAGKGS